MSTQPQNGGDAVRTRQRRTLAILATLLIVGGLVVLFVLTRMPGPLRILVGLTDIVGGAVLLVLVRQKFPRK
jgi:uncharacterized membrane protein HdeD (DUF308 family)